MTLIIENRMYIKKPVPEGKTLWTDVFMEKHEPSFGALPYTHCPFCDKGVSTVAAVSCNCCAREKMALMFDSVDIIPADTVQ